MRVKINLRNGFYYSGNVLKEDHEFITILDKHDKVVEINKKDISTKEVLD